MVRLSQVSLDSIPRPNGEYTREKARRWLYYLFPGVILPDGPPHARGPLEVLVGASHRFIQTFSGDILVVVIVVFTVDYLFTRVHVFFPEIVLRRN